QKAARLVDPEGHQLKVVQIDQAADALKLAPGVLPVLQVASLAADLPWGQIDGRAGRFAGECVVWAAQAALQQQIAAFVTAPLHKEALSAAGAS
ncbi:MAG: 4-hydroxythreonine-4-phosphate dehydrogenase PdxA, partial [Gemmatimonadaceae bacterium]|nr:4-hydroxythreonine-4-phosphate dehydrogenase PdxA [Gemmatimonadaceae bacterium]